MNRTLKIVIKLLIICALTIFALCNYRVFTFNKGISKTNIENKNISQAISMLINIEKVEYYEKTIKQDNYIYNVYIQTNDDVYLFLATQDDIDSFKTMSLFSGNLKPQKISPIPFYVEIIIGFVILIIPIRSKK